MHDQASKLRTLVSRVQRVERATPRARQIVLSGCKGGVGTTTLAVNLAIALQRQVDRVLLVDANAERGDIATLCRLQPAETNTSINDEPASSQTLITGPAGISVLSRSALAAEAAMMAARRTLRQIDALNYSFDVVVVDAGSCPLTAETLWQGADRAVVVTTTDHVAVTDAYALVKYLHRQHVVADVGFVVNRFKDESLAGDISRRLVDSCRLFLNLSVASMGAVPQDGSVDRAQDCGRTVVCAHPEAAASQAIEGLASSWWTEFCDAEAGSNKAIA